MPPTPPYSQSQTPSRGHAPSTFGRVSFPDCSDTDPSLPLRSVVVTHWGGGSYDELFRRLPQKIPDGRASVWQFHPEHFRAVALTLAEGRLPPEVAANRELATAITELTMELAQVSAENVVFNWECCAAWSTHWPDPRAFSELCRVALDRQYLLMFGDFAMKSLIHGWDASFLGPNPFLEVGAITGPMNLAFDPARLAESGSMQLELLGELCERGGAVIQTMSNTIVFTVDPPATDTDKYKLDLFTVATNTAPTQPGPLCSLGVHRGTVGHAMLTYPNGGRMLCSSGHWIELLRLDATQESLLRSAESRYGAKYRDDLEKQIMETPAEQRGEKMQQLSRAYVQQSSPTRFTKKT